MKKGTRAKKISLKRAMNDGLNGRTTVAISRTKARIL
jgi:hypothetical protein